jgi:hypothetical protein
MGTAMSLKITRPIQRQRPVLRDYIDEEALLLANETIQYRVQKLQLNEN